MITQATHRLVKLVIHPDDKRKKQVGHTFVINDVNGIYIVKSFQKLKIGLEEKVDSRQLWK